jgi:hypothetical protein
MITFRGETLPLMAWTTRLGLPYFTIHARIKHGWSVEDALTKPVRAGNYRRSRKLN